LRFQKARPQTFQNADDTQVAPVLPFNRRGIDQTKYLGIKAGARSDHRVIGIWGVVVDGRVFVRSWTLKSGGWYRTFLEDPLGVLQFGRREVRVRAVLARSERIRLLERLTRRRSTPPGRSMVDASSQKCSSKLLPYRIAPAGAMPAASQ
jgi:hypothetical protein